MNTKDSNWSWLVCVGSFMTHVLIDGVTYSFGVYVEAFAQEFESGRGHIGLLGSLLVGVSWCSGPLASIIANKFGCRTASILGTSIASCGFILSIFSTSIQFMYLTFGIIAGIGLGMAYLPAIVMVSHWFDVKRSLAMGLAVSGSGIGTTLFASLTHLLLENYGWRGSVLIQAGILLNCIACGLVFLQCPSNSTSPLHITPSSLEEGKEIVGESDLKKTASIESNSFLSVAESHKCMLIDARRRCRMICDTSLLLRMDFLLFCFSNMLTSLGFCVPYIFLADRAQHLDQWIDNSMAAALISIVGIANTIGRILFGWLADRKCVNRLILYNTVLVLCGLVSIMSALCLTYPLMATYAALFGLFIGVYVCLTPLVIVDIVGLDKMSSGFGLVLWFNGIGAFVGPPIAGHVFDLTHNYNYSFYLMGVCILVSGLMLFSINIYEKILLKKIDS